MALGSFELDIAKWCEKAGGNIDLVIRKISLDVFKRVVMKTAVDSGRARGSWQCAIGSIPSGQVNHLDKSGAATISRIAATVSSAKAGDVVYLMSSLSYIRPLEYGWSKQSPNGMVRITLAEFPQVVRKAVSELPK